MRSTLGVSDLLEAASKSDVPAVPPNFPSVQTLKSLALDPQAKKFLDAIDSRVSAIFKSPSDQRKLLEQQLLYAFLVRPRVFQEDPLPRPSLEAAVAAYFATGGGVLRDMDELQHENARLKVHLKVIERVLLDSGVAVPVIPRSPQNVPDSFTISEFVDLVATNVYL